LSLALVVALVALVVGGGPLTLTLPNLTKQNKNDANHIICEKHASFIIWGVE
jgi:hypothetical protein